MASALPFGLVTMRRRTRFSYIVAVLILTGLACGNLSAGTSETSICPANFDCSQRLEGLLAKGMARSTSFRHLVERLESHPDVHLEFGFRRQKPGRHAESHLILRGTYVRNAGGMRRQVTGIAGKVTVPKVAYGFRQIELLAHELRHVQILLEGAISHGSAEEEQEAIRFERRVRTEIEAAK